MKLTTGKLTILKRSKTSEMEKVVVLFVGPHFVRYQAGDQVIRTVKLLTFERWVALAQGKSTRGAHRGKSVRSISTPSGGQPPR